LNKIRTHPEQNTAPMRVLLPNKSVEALNNTFKNDAPTSLRYTIEDLKDLYLMFGEDFVTDTTDTIDKLKVKILINQINTESAEEIFWKLYKSRKEKVLNKVFKILYQIPLRRIPLYINHPYLYLIAKWRLKINK